jgi:hypothetical protein
VSVCVCGHAESGHRGACMVAVRLGSPTTLQVEYVICPCNDYEGLPTDGDETMTADSSPCCDYTDHSPGPCACPEHERSEMHPFGLPTNGDE